eukprot:m.123256 g.123256  ORF g.123256 m.123256 type:complete len:187 (+) comp52152_c0_seq1:60-620(+)
MGRSRSASPRRSRSPGPRRTEHAREADSHREPVKVEVKSEVNVVHPDSSLAAEARPELVPVNREKVCPFLLRIFYSYHGHHLIDDYRTTPPAQEIQVYTWLDASLSEITTLIKEVNEQARKRGTKISFKTVYRDRRGFLAMKELGIVVNGDKTPDEKSTLQLSKFQIGDYLDVDIMAPRDLPPRRF